MSVSVASPEPGAPLVRLERVTRRYGGVTAAEDVSLTIAAGDFAVITGRSGSGKSTLLALLGTLTKPTEGRVTAFGEDISELDDPALSELRARRIGFAFQFTGLLPTLTVFDNVRLPSLFAGPQSVERDLRARDLLRRMGLGERLEHLPPELSGGEQRRVAIARALFNEPDLLLADEPTGDLDSETERAILDLFESLHSDGLTIVLVTHNLELKDHATRWLTMRDGRLSEPGAD